MTPGPPRLTLRAMDTQSTTSPLSQVIGDLFTLSLVDGLAVEAGGKTIKYRTVRLRETTVGDERMAARMAERVATVGGVPKLLVSESDFRYAMTLRHCAQFECDGQVIPQAVLDLEIFGKLSAHDLQLIEERVVLITLAAQVRYGVMTPQQFDEFVAGRMPAQDASPQPVGQTASVGPNGDIAESGPALLADYVGGHAQGAAAGDGAGLGAARI